MRGNSCSYICKKNLLRNKPHHRCLSSLACFQVTHTQPLRSSVVSRIMELVEGAGWGVVRTEYMLTIWFEICGSDEEGVIAE